jgi:hypothetical protein
MADCSDELDPGYAMDCWPTDNPVSPPKYEFWHDLEAMTAHAQEIINAGQIKRALLFKVEGGPSGWKLIGTLPE